MENSLFLPASHLMTTLSFSAEEWGWEDINFLIVKSRNGSHVNEHQCSELVKSETAVYKWKCNIYVLQLHNNEMKTLIIFIHNKHYLT